MQTSGSAKVLGAMSARLGELAIVSIRARHEHEVGHRHGDSLGSVDCRAKLVELSVGHHERAVKMEPLCFRLSFSVRTLFWNAMQVSEDYEHATTSREQHYIQQNLFSYA